jgi:hypothetical protein
VGLVTDVPYLATQNVVPGYLPQDDDPPTFVTSGDAWQYLAEERRNDEDNTPGMHYGETVNTLDAYASAGHGEDTVYGPTPGYDGDHDHGLAYSVTVIKVAVFTLAVVSVRCAIDPATGRPHEDPTRDGPFGSLDEAVRFVKRESWGSSTWRVVISEDGIRVMTATRRGNGRTGRNWTFLPEGQAA